MKKQAMSDEQRAMSKPKKLIAYCSLLLTEVYYGSN
jgi:hypothetical protein